MQTIIKTLYPEAFEFNGAMIDKQNKIIINLKSKLKAAICPTCGTMSIRPHSLTKRIISDLPILGQQVVLHITVQKYRCKNFECNLKIFAESVEGFTDQRFKRSTKRLHTFLKKIAFECTGQAGARICKDNITAISGSKLLRLVRDSEFELITCEKVGVDDWAFKKRSSYGTIIVDLDGRGVVDVVAGRDDTSLKDWLKKINKSS
jgi:transposase